MLLVSHQTVIKSICFFQGIAHRIQTAVPRRLGGDCLPFVGGCDLGGDPVHLLEMYAVDAVRLHDVFKFLLEQLEDLLRKEFFMGMVGDGLGRIAHGLAHLSRQVQAEFCLQDIAHAAFSGLAVDPYILSGNDLFHLSYCCGPMQQ